MKRLRGMGILSIKRLCSMGILPIGCLLVLSLWLTGCVKEQKVGVISGTVTDVEGNPVANAEVTATGGVVSSTRTLHNGTFYLTKVSEGFTTIRVRARVNNREYTGQQVAQVFPNEQSKNINIMVAPAELQGSVEGLVLDPLGRGIERARVFVGGALSSALAVTDRRGYYRIDGLPSGYEYPIVASAPGYENVQQTVAIRARETSVVSFALNYSSNRPVNAPQNLTATAWTMPRDLMATRDNRQWRAYNAIRALFDGRLRDRPLRPPSRAAGEYWIEVDLSWDFEQQPSLLGYGIFRGTTLQELESNAIAFLRDPLADFFADLDPTLQPNVTYYYETIAVNTDYLDDPDHPNAKSGRSNRVAARPFVPIQVTQPRPDTLVDSRGLIISWTPVERADYYLVMIYDRFPDYQVQPFYPSD
ncbi:MAG: carboxypeptidase-like regulatory domain-containing protein, partial [Fimbriimonadales bacterium]|nr:carboxypeptidase-like regulatory domain-containing protein [Fimbriimonadales bacterium]